jgi:hypothetical protein
MSFFAHMNPTLSSYEQKVQQVEQLVQDENIKNNVASKKELLQLTKELESEEAALAKNILEESGKETLRQLQARKEKAIKNIDFSDIQSELSDVKNTVTKTTETTNGITGNTTTETISETTEEIEEKDSKPKTKKQ